MKPLLVIGHGIPEPQSTGAGVRMVQLLRLCSELGYKVHFCSTAEQLSDSCLDALNIPYTQIELNRDSFNQYVAHLDPQIVMFDRFMTEEQFGWRVQETCPNALRILDTEDLHFLRHARAHAIKENQPTEKLNFSNDITYREIAAMYRCDLSLIISEYEVQLLKNNFDFPAELLHYLPFLIDSESIIQPQELPNFKERNDLVFLGNYLHKPNVDAVLRLKEVIWPELKSLLPDASLHIYGAYISQAIQKLDSPEERFFVKGYSEDIHAVFANAKLLLAPLRFGAGLKGKIIDAWQAGTPVITTKVGAEGLAESSNFGGAIASSEEDFILLASKLFTDESCWKNAQQNGVRILKNRFDRDSFKTSFSERINTLRASLSQHRDANFTGQMLWHHSLQSSKYLSKWIQEKNKSKEPPAS